MYRDTDTVPRRATWYPDFVEMNASQQWKRQRQRQRQMQAGRAWEQPANEKASGCTRKGSLDKKSNEAGTLEGLAGCNGLRWHHDHASNASPKPMLFEARAGMSWHLARYIRKVRKIRYGESGCKW